MLPRYITGMPMALQPGTISRSTVQSVKEQALLAGNAWYPHF
jgi:hypothetical protein